MSTSDPIERAKAHAGQMYPEAEIRTRSVRDRPVVLAIEGSDEGADLIRLIQLSDLDAERASGNER